MAISRKGRLTCVHDHPKYSPVAARHREIPRIRNENKCTRLPEYSPARAPCLACAGSAPRNPPHQKRKQSYTITRILARRGSLSCPRGLRAERERHTNRNYPCGTVYIFPKVCYNTENATAKTEKAQNNGNEEPPTKGAGQREKQRGGDRPSAADVEIRAGVG